MGYGNADSSEGAPMRFHLNAKDRKEVQSIADALPDSELQDVAREVDEYMDRHHVNPLMMAAQTLIQQMYGGPVAQMLDGDDEAHIKMDEILRELLITAGKNRRSVNIMINKVA
ncbi:MAG: hypothetical protein PW844_19045 [Pantoea sp.]|uniref:hypothetical protein n=1 Tax=Pantoea sp. TaxID=69393 RepID=UPI002386EA66|nr:hypothetical protein [Pantoea sp.]MDE1188546.1 hypothetical protein [Pantoea sp.]